MSSRTPKRKSEKTDVRIRKQSRVSHWVIVLHIALFLSLTSGSLDEFCCWRTISDLSTTLRKIWSPEQHVTVLGLISCLLFDCLNRRWVASLSCASPVEVVHIENVVLLYLYFSFRAHGASFLLSESGSGSVGAVASPFVSKQLPLPTNLNDAEYKALNITTRARRF